MGILLVEDQEEIWDVLSRRPERRGFEVVKDRAIAAGCADDGSKPLDVSGLFAGIERYAPAKP